MIRGEAHAVDGDAVESWRKHVLADVLEAYDPKDIYNADETGLFFRMQPEKSLVGPDEDGRGGKRCKERLTVLPCANMDGSDKRRLLVIGKSTKPSCFKGVSLFPVDYKVNKKAWMTADLWQSYLQRWNQFLLSNFLKHFFLFIIFLLVFFLNQFAFLDIQ